MLNCFITSNAFTFFYFLRKKGIHKAKLSDLNSNFEGKIK